MSRPSPTQAPPTPDAAAAPADQLALIDLGTNTFHLVVVALEGPLQYRVIEKYKAYVKLGADGGLAAGELAPEPYARGLEAMRRFRAVLDGLGNPTVWAYATSALRGAANGPAFVQDVARETGIHIRIINGNEEAALIYQGIRRGLTLPLQEDALMVDIGGGSVEFIVGNEHLPKLIRSVDCGVARHLAFLSPSDPYTPDDQARARQWLGQRLDPLLAELASFAPKTLVGSSGTFETLAALVARQRGQKGGSDQLHGYRYGRADFKQAFDWLMASTKADRANNPAIEGPRVEMIGLGALTLAYILEALPSLEDVVTSTYALKEGMLFRYLEEEWTPAERGTEAQTQRLNAIRALARRYHSQEPHTEQVAKLSLELFDALQALHGYGPREREYLHYAALLHDIGHYINDSGHHKHAQYIILNAKIPGLTADEQLLIANLVRYHRKSLPNKEHMHFNLLYREHKDLVRRLAALLRLADSLDRSKRQIVDGLDVTLAPGQVQVAIRAAQNVQMELDHADQNRELFEEAYQISLHFAANT